MKKITVHEIVLAAILAAASITLNFFSISNLYSRITLYSLPLLVAGIFCGPVVSTLTGVVVGFITQLLSEYGLTITTPLWMITPVIWSTISWLIFNLFKKKKGSFISIVVTVVATSLCATAYNTIALWLDGIIMHYPTPLIWATIGTRILTAGIVCIPYIILIYETYVRIPNKYKYNPVLNEEN